MEMPRKIPGGLAKQSITRTVSSWRLKSSMSVARAAASPPQPVGPRKTTHLDTDVIEREPRSGEKDQPDQCEGRRGRGRAPAQAG